MRNVSGLTAAGQQYAAAHAAHYGTKDLREALELYKDIMAAHSNTQEAGYSRSQILNIVKTVVPEQEFYDAQVDLALAHLEHGDQPNVKRAPVAPLASEGRDVPARRESHSTMERTRAMASSDRPSGQLLEKLKDLRAMGDWENEGGSVNLGSRTLSESEEGSVSSIGPLYKSTPALAFLARRVGRAIQSEAAASNQTRVERSKEL